MKNKRELKTNMNDEKNKRELKTNMNDEKTNINKHNIPIPAKPRPSKRQLLLHEIRNQ